MKAFVSKFLAFKFTYVYSSEEIIDVLYPETMERGFKSLIPKLIDLFIPAMRKDQYDAKPKEVTRPGLGKLTEVYTLEDLGDRVKLRKTFSKQGGEEGLNQTFDYLEEAIFSKNLLMENVLYTNTSIASSPTASGEQPS